MAKTDEEKEQERLDREAKNKAQDERLRDFIKNKIESRGRPSPAQSESGYVSVRIGGTDYLLKGREL